MCLERKCWLKPKHSGEGWRAFGVTEGNGLKSLYFSMFHRSFPIDKWVHKREFSLYPISPGFYIFKHKRDADRLVAGLSRISTVKRVLYRKAHTKGYYYSSFVGKTIIADEMMILDNPKQVP